MLIQPMTAADWPAVETIYAAGIATGNATFASAPPPDWASWSASKIAACSLVARHADAVAGWVAVSPVSARAVYAGVVEHSIYIAPAAAGQGVGRALLIALAEVTEAHGIWTIQSSVFPENAASLALHTRCGFRVVGRRVRIGLMTYGPWAGQWRDTLLLERRSERIGGSMSVA
jgi:L-amino acid N-acyltransferase YncA